MNGITAFGVHVPRLRLQRSAIAEAHAWSRGRGGKPPPGTRSMCNWDEDALTMAVEAGRDCVAAAARGRIGALTLASTTLPHADRQNAGIAALALGLGEDLVTQDLTGSQRAGTGALITAARMQLADDRDTLVIATDHRATRAGAPHEARFGDAAAAVVLGRQNVLAEILAIETLAVDFIDHFRAADAAVDYYWEERWIRDEGALKILPRAIANALHKAGLAADQIDHVILPEPVPQLRAKLCKDTGLREAALAAHYAATIGDTGCAHPLLMLVGVLETAKPGQTILLASFGQGSDVLVLRTTEAIGQHQPLRGLSGAEAARREVSDYGKFLGFNGVIDRELGMRAEGDQKTALTQLWRKRQLLTTLEGGCCSACGTRQIPKTRYCVNPDCAALDSQEPHVFADTAAKVLTWSADHISFTPDPPAYYGLIAFEGGGRMFANFAEIDPAALEVGTTMRMAFRIKDIDQKRNFRRYFWKAIPVDQLPPKRGE